MPICLKYEHRIRLKLEKSKRQGSRWQLVGRGAGSSSVGSGRWCRQLVSLLRTKVPNPFRGAKKEKKNKGKGWEAIFPSLSNESFHRGVMRSGVMEKGTVRGFGHQSKPIAKTYRQKQTTHTHIPTLTYSHTHECVCVCVCYWAFGQGVWRDRGWYARGRILPAGYVDIIFLSREIEKLSRSICALRGSGSSLGSKRRLNTHTCIPRSCCLSLERKKCEK